MRLLLMLVLVFTLGCSEKKISKTKSENLSQTMLENTTGKEDCNDESKILKELEKKNKNNEILLDEPGTQGCSIE